MKPPPLTNDYFDEAYFQRGWERGTAYANYRESAASSLIFKNVGRCINEVFSPKLALEIGCATGAIVRELNELGAKTYGIDVSDWAVSNALHPNVMLASAGELPFQDRTFDVVYSSHALEHLPESVSTAAFREIDRVCSEHAVQFHMLPIIGTYPYDYDHAAAMADLQKDPTHTLLKTISWWIQRWEELGWEYVPASVLIPVDTENVELSSGQFCLVRKGAGNFHSVLNSINAWNSKVYRQTYLDAQDALKKGADSCIHISSRSEALPKGIGPCNSHWDDLKRDLVPTANLESAQIHGVLALDSKVSAKMRIALISDTGDVLEKWLFLEPGTTLFTLNTDDFDIVSGDRNLKSISAIYFGGEIGDFVVTCNMAIVGPNTKVEDLFFA